MTAGPEGEPRVWIGCLACYNDGRLVGNWFDADGAAEVTISQIHGDAPGFEHHEELWVMDHEGFCGLLDGECSPAVAQARAEVIATFRDGRDDGQLIAFGAYVKHLTSPDQVKNWDEMMTNFEEAYQGEAVSMEEYAEQLAEDVRPWPSDAPEQKVLEMWPYCHIDWEAAAEALEDDGYFTADTPGGGVYVFKEN